MEIFIPSYGEVHLNLIKYSSYIKISVTPLQELTP